MNALTWMNGTSPERLFAELVTANYFETLGVSPRLGRFFLPDEGRAPGAPSWSWATPRGSTDSARLPTSSAAGWS